MTIEAFKQFLKPDRKKILLGLIFLFFSSIPICPVIYCEHYDLLPGVSFTSTPIFYNLGFPFKYLLEGDIVYINLLFDIIFWYFISCLLIFAWARIKNKFH